jgi:hypothetical protein
MRYVYQEPIITTISDEDVNDEKDIKTLLERLKGMQHGVYMEFEDAETPDHRRALENVRITEIRDTEVDIHAFFTNASVRYRKIPLLNIRKIRLLANKQTVSKKYKVARWHMMDVAEIGE